MDSKKLEKLNYIILVLGVLCSIIVPILKPKEVEQGFQLVKSYNFSLLFLILAVTVILFIILNAMTSIIKNTEAIIEQNREILTYTGNKKTELTSFIENTIEKNNKNKSIDSFTVPSEINIPNKADINDYNAPLNQTAEATDSSDGTYEAEVTNTESPAESNDTTQGINVASQFYNMDDDIDPNFLKL